MDYSVDKYDMRGQMHKFNTMAKEGYKLGKDVKLKNQNTVWICGMGGSGVPGLITKNLSPRIQMIRDYHIPNLKKDDTVIIISYSGNTEEAISCHRDALRVGAEILIISTGGKLIKNVSKDSQHIQIPKGFQPRVALPYLFFSTLRVLVDNKIVQIDEKPDVEVDIPSVEQNGKKLAEVANDKTIIIYASPKLYPAAYRWKTQINENAKEHAFANEFSELNHNELEAWSSKTNYHVIFMHHEREYSRMQKRIDLTKKAAKKSGSTVTHLKVKGKHLHSLFQTLLLGDWFSYYKALNKGIDPTPVNTIEDFKKEMGPFV